MRVGIIGAGAAGLLTAEILSRSGHEVTVVEGDNGEIPVDDEAAWDSWKRPGVNQLRQPHALLPGALATMASELPELSADLASVDAVGMDIARFAPDGVDRSTIPSLKMMGIRRATFERRLLLLVLANDDITLQFRTRVEGLTITTTGAIPTVTGLQTSAGDIVADLVVDASGRRTPIPTFLDQSGIPYETARESDGFTYFSRWFRVPDGVQGQPVGGVGLTPGAVVLQFPSDGRTIGVALAASIKDKPFRNVRDESVFMRLAEAVPTLAPLLGDAEALTDVIPMGSIQNRYLRLAGEGNASVAGLVCVGDSSVSTNPSLGRGIALAVRSAVRLRDLLDTQPSPLDAVAQWHSDFDREGAAWHRDAIDSDSWMRAVFEAARTGQSQPQPTNARTAVAIASGQDAEIWSEWVQVVAALRSPADVVGNAGLVQRAREIAHEAPPPKFLMNRSELEALLAG